MAENQSYKTVVMDLNNGGNASVEGNLNVQGQVRAQTQIRLQASNAEDSPILFRSNPNNFILFTNGTGDISARKFQLSDSVETDSDGNPLTYMTAQSGKVTITDLTCNALNVNGVPITGDGSGGATTVPQSRVIIGTSTNGWTSSDCTHLCDGTNDAEVIAAAFEAVSDNGSVYFLEGEYHTGTGFLVEDKFNVHIEGAGNVLIHVGTESIEEQMFKLDGCTDCIIANLTFQNTTQYDYKISLCTCYHTTLTNVNLQGVWVEISESEYIDINKCTFNSDECVSGISCTNSSGYLQINDNTFNNSSRVRIDSTHHLTIHNNQFLNYNFINTADRFAVSLNDINYGSKVTDNYIVNSNARCCGIEVSGSATYGVVMSNNHINCTGDTDDTYPVTGLSISDAYIVNVSGNIIMTTHFGTVASNCDQIIIASNYSQGNTETNSIKTTECTLMSNTGNVTGF